MIICAVLLLCSSATLAKVGKEKSKHALVRSSGHTQKYLPLMYKRGTGHSRKTDETARKAPEKETHQERRFYGGHV
ncbi:unnamed protein product [Allacma fusca]|uniref:Secreted protein n=1 Tax=Allacma fusca TaxID=39272 RepID=A0A8J2PBS0_9HEXA|nr:unnamed protein product [Allacma fusca]